MRQIIGACPLDCPDACSWIVSVDEDDQAVKLRGNPEHPFTRGGLCKKVNPWLDFAADPSRLMKPLRRSGPKGAGTFAEISWTEALDEIADRLLDVRSRYGGEAVWPFTGTGNMGWIQGASGEAGSRLWNLFGASRHAGTICSISGHVGLGYSIGTAAAMDPEDVAHAGVILLWGTNTLVANQHFWPFVAEAEKNGAEIVVIDPARTRTARRAAHHLALRPGTDGALALGLCRSVLDHGGSDPEFLSAFTAGWPEFEELLEEWPVDRAAGVCGLEPAEIDDLGALIARRGPLAIKLGQGMQRQANGGQAARTVSCLAALTGAYRQKGGGLVYSTSPAYRLDHFGRQRPDLLPGPVRSLAMTNLGRNLLELDDPPIKALIVSGANPLVSNPQVDLVRRGLEQDDLFTVAIDLYPTETTAYADIILPSAMQHEQTELTESFAHLYVNWNEPAVAPPGECRTHTDIYRALASALAARDRSFDHPLLHVSDLELAADVLGSDPYVAAGVTVARLRKEGFIRIPRTSPYEPFSERFPTASGRFEFASARAEGDGHGRLPEFRPPAESPSERTNGDPGASAAGRYSLLAIGGEWHVNSVFAGTSITRSRTSAPPVVVHPTDAARDGLIAGDEVLVANDRGSFAAGLVVDDAARPGVALMTKGWWGQGVNATVREVDSDMGRGAVFHDNVVDITKIGPRQRPEEAKAEGSER